MKRMGFEGQALYGVAGTTATNLLTNTRDINYLIKNERGETTVRGTSGIPKKTSRVACLDMDGLEIQFVNDDTDANLEAIRVKVAAGEAFAIRLRDRSAGKGFDGDVVGEFSAPFPLKSEQLVTLTMYPTNEGGREPSPYV